MVKVVEVAFGFVIIVMGGALTVYSAAKRLQINGRNEHPVAADVAIVLGAYTDGYRPSLPLRARLRAALHLYRINYVQYFIVSGGMGTDETVSEARAMKRFLMLNGVSPDYIIEERYSTDTWENLRNTKQLMDKHQFQTAVVVTSDYHLPRALAVGRKLEMNLSGYSARSTKREFRFAVREVFALLRYSLHGKTTH